MPIVPGSRLGPFEILSPLGAGGMGEVWRARDGRLQREVAIKVLPAALAGDSERLARFEREARLLASMNHPRIGGLLGLEDVDGVPALVLELIEGPTLAEHLAKRGSLPPTEAIEIASQIAEAMEYAHERGIVHRDLKPANVKFTADGMVKVLDFGLAKALLGEDGSSSDPHVSQSPTITLGTHAGVILGTAAYMAPEQARGKVVDRRADIWAFGVVLFEMLTGRPLFGGETVSDTIARILEREPEWNLLPPQTPERVRELLRRCLEKDARKRLRDIGDARLDLEAARRDVASGILPASAGGTRARVPVLVWIGVAALVAAAFMGGMWMRGTQRGARSGVVRMSVVPPPGLLVRNLWISSDGRTMLARGETRKNEPGQEPQRRLYRRMIDSFKWEPLPGTDGVRSYDISEDGQWVYFVGPSAPGASQEQMSRLAIDGSAPPTFMLPWQARWAAWDALPQGGFAVTIGGDSIGVIEPGQTAPHSWNKIAWDVPVQNVSLEASLPGGRACIGTIGYFATNGWNVAAVAFELQTGKIHLIERNAASPRLTPEGRVLLTRGATVLAAPFDLRTMRRTAEPVAVFEGVRLGNQWGHGVIGIGGSGTLVYVPGESEARQRWVAVIRPGAEPQEWNSERRDFEKAPSVSLDGRLVAITNVPPGSATYEILLLTRGQIGARRLVAVHNEDCANPVFSPDGRFIAFLRQGVAATAGVYVIEVGSASPARLVLAAKNNTSAYDVPRSWTPDGSSILVDTFESHAARLRMIKLSEGAATVQEVFSTRGNAYSGMVSPDGRTIAFLDNENGSSQASIASIGADGRAGPSVQVSRGGAGGLCWSPEGRTLTFTTPERVLMESRIAPDLSFSPPTLRARLAGHINDLEDYTIAPDGSIIVTHKAANEGDVTQFHLVLGFSREVERALSRKPSR